MEMKGVELAHWTRFHCADFGKSSDTTREGARPGGADLGNLLGQKFPPWQTASKEATAFTHAIRRCEIFM